MDDKTTVGELKKRVQTFCEERDWDQFHGAKDVAIGIVTEASELLANFRFLTTDLSALALADPGKRVLIEGELADVLFFVLRLAQRFEIDLEDSLRQKLEINAARYPVEKARGRNLKYTEL
jgi:NTP pyrophosphatase (non-canonical NTP hydrolase)